MNKMLIFLGLSFSLFSEIYHFNKEKLIESYRDFKEFRNFLASKDQQLGEDAQKKYDEFIGKLKEIEEDKNFNKEEKDKKIKTLSEEFNKSLERIKLNKKDIASSFENKINLDIKQALKKLVNDNLTVLEGPFILYSSKDITKELSDVLSGKDVKKLNAVSKAKIYSLDLEEFLRRYKGAKEVKNSLEEKRKEIQNKANDIIENEQDKQLATYKLMALSKEISDFEEFLMGKVFDDLEKAISSLAADKKIDLVVTSKIAYSNTINIIDLVLKELEKEQANKKIEDNKTSSIGYISYESIFENYKKYKNYQEEKTKREIEFTHILQEKKDQIQKLIDQKDDSKKQEIERLEKEFESFRDVKVEELSRSNIEKEEEVINDIKSAAKLVATKKNLELVVLKAREVQVVFYGGQNLTDDVLNILNEKR